MVKNWDWLKGLHKLKRESNNNTNNNDNDVNYLYVNRGLATHPPMRFNCNPELTILILEPSRNNKE